MCLAFLFRVSLYSFGFFCQKLDCSVRDRIFEHLIVPECKTSKKISFMAPTRKMEFDHVINTRKH